MRLPLSTVALWFLTQGHNRAEVTFTSPPVTIGLKTPWSAPGLLLETLELLPKFAPNTYFPFLKKILAFPQISQSETTSFDWDTEEAYQSTLDLIFDANSGFLNPDSRSLFEFYLAVHSTAPAVQAYYQYYSSNVIPEMKNSNTSTFDPNCPNWAYIQGLQLCNLVSIENAINLLKLSSDLETHKVETLVFDHVYSPLKLSYKDPVTTVVLYGDVTNQSFAPIHQFLSQVADDGIIHYILRYKPPQSQRGGLALSGYGVHLDLKNTEYRAVDDRSFDQNEELEGEAPLFNSEYASLNYTLINKLILDPPVVTSLKDSELNDIEFKMARVILSSSKPLAIWSYLTQNFPKHAPLIAKKKNKKNQCNGIVIGEGYFHRSRAQDSIFINGISVSLSEVDVFRLLDLFRIEQKTIQDFGKLGIESKDAIEFMKLSTSSKQEDIFVDTFDTRDVQEGEKVVLWLNDLEKDSAYKSWPNDLEELTNSIFGGYLPRIRLNYASVLFAFDLSTLENLETIVSEIIPLIKSKAPIRFGLIPLISAPSDEATVMSNFIHYVHDLKGREGLVTVLQAIYQNVEQGGTKLVKLPETIFKNELATEFENFEAFQASEWYTNQRAYVHDYMRRLNLKLDTPKYFVNGKCLDFSGNYQRPLLTALGSQLSFLSDQIQDSKVNEETNIYDFFLSQPGVYRSYNPFIFGADINDHQTNLFTTFLGSNPKTLEIIDNLGYLTSATDDMPPPISILVAVDLNSEQGEKLVSKAIEFTMKDSRARVTLIHLATSPIHDHGLSSIIYKGLHQFDQTPVSPSELQSLLVSHKASPEQFSLEQEKQFWDIMRELFLDAGLSVSSPFLVINGKSLKLVGPNASDYVDFETLCSYELNQRLRSIRNALMTSNFVKAINATEKADLFMRVSGILGQNIRNHAEIARFETSPGARNAFPEFSAEKCRLTSGTMEGAWAQIKYILNPLSKEGQNWAPILQVLSNLDGVYLDGYMSPSSEIENAKQLSKRFYRYVLSHQLAFDPVRKTMLSPSARFNQLPTDALLTAGLDTISAWLVTPTRSIYDLDNIELGRLGSKFSTPGVEAEFELKNLLVEGHARDTTTQSSPRGLEFILGTPSQPNLVDTVVMANLGYFQLKANPGVFRMALRDGRSSELYDIRTIGLQGLTQVPQVDQHREIILNSFGGAVLFPRVSKKPGKEQQNLITDDTDSPASSGVWSSLTKKLFKDQSKDVASKSKSVINVFTVASGHLYERFLSVMILSVIKNTKSSVKFWFIENFLSPSFKEFIPKMASRYGFDYEFVTYQWPHWLNSQTEKQRIIWGYKILFLDVLFPLNVGKVIFVDADQVVRADLQELVDHDLKGAAYGYVPFCKSRDSMKGYRFWEQGYWADHLEGKPYHISALYVVDLQRFRALAAGDQLRGHYQMLSYDPNSLANLDQDLPNHLQPKMPIHSLPQEWLWCETWCDDASLSKAKTIDLCNNPETKEPKLDRARRILPEWQEYDDEIAPLRDAIFKPSKMSSDNSAPPSIQDSDADKDEL